MKRKHTKTRYAMTHGHNVMNLPGVNTWLIPPDNASAAEKRQGFDRVMTLTNDNRAALAKIFGPRDQTFTSEFRHDVWRIEHGGLYFWVLSAKSKGTGIEMEMPEVWKPENEAIVLDFLETLYSELKEIDDDID